MQVWMLPLPLPMTDIVNWLWYTFLPSLGESLSVSQSPYKCCSRKLLPWVQNWQMWNLIAITTKIGLTVVVAISSLDSQAHQNLWKRYIAFFNETKKEYINIFPDWSVTPLLNSDSKIITTVCWLPNIDHLLCA